MNSFIKFFAITALFVLAFAVAPQAHADTGLNTAAALNGPTTNSGVATGLNEVLKFVFLFLKFLAIVACGWGSYQMWKGEFSSGIWAYIAALALFFSPALVDLAQSIGVKASGGSGIAGIPGT